MKMDNNMVPQLRFPEFDGEWNEKKIGNFGKVSMCKRILKAQTSNNGNIPFYKIGTFGKKANAYISQQLFDNYKNKYSYPKIGDILISAAGTIGRTVVFDGTPAYFQDSNIVWIDNDENIITNSFLHLCYQNVRWNTENTTIPRLYNGSLREIKIYLPSLPEQTKIATFLTAVDKRINLLKKKKAKLEKYKKGVMQKIFSQEIRFKDDNGNDFPDWEEKKLGDICKVQGGFAFKSSNFIDKGIPVIRISNISNNNNFIDTSNMVYYEKIQNGQNYIIRKGDLLIAMSGATTGKTSIFNLEDIAYVNQRVGLFKSLSAELFYPFVIQYVLYDDFKNQLKSLLVAGAQPNISSNDIESTTIQLPKKDEQIKIANFLSSIDKSIEKLGNQIDNSIMFKKGLLQKMFV